MFQLPLRLFKSTKNKRFKSFTHVDEHTNKPKMVDIGHKNVTKRSATAISHIRVSNDILSLLDDRSGSSDIYTKKGPVFSTAIIAGTMAAKKTSDLIPFCHPIPIEKCDITIDIQSPFIIVKGEVSSENKTGVEMEALTAVSVASLTIYDMCKSYGHDMTIEETKLLKKSGGKSDYESQSSF